LTPEGRREAERLGPLLAGLHLRLVLCSPRRRAAETCEAAGLADRAEIDPDLAEWDYGDYEGLTTTEIRAARPGWTLWDDGVPGGESASSVGSRCDQVIARADAVDGDVVLFSHGHLLRVLAARWIGLDPSGGRHLALSPGTISRLGYERESRVVLGWNRSP
jgi:probable phosphoglycerate mutase